MIKLVINNSFNFCKQLINKPTDVQQNSMVKLSKWISMKSVCSRKQAEQFIKLGLVRIDGKRIYDNLMVPYDANIKAFTIQGVQVQKPVTRLWMINKPRGYICSHRDPQNRPSIYSLLPPIFKSFGYIVSVGRLDFNSQGLLLLTNDVKLKNLLQNPLADLTRLYRVKVHGRVTPEKLQKMTKPMIINQQQYGPLQVTVDRALTTNIWLNIALKTGKNRQIRRIMQKCDLQVNKLVRLQYGKYKLGSLEHGSIRQLPVSEGLQRKLKIVKAKQLKTNSNCLIQIDIRQKAIQIATQQYNKKIASQNKKPQTIEHKQIKKQAIANKNKSKNKNKNSQEQSSTSESTSEETSEDSSQDQISK